MPVLFVSHASKDDGYATALEVWLNAKPTSLSIITASPAAISGAASTEILDKARQAGARLLPYGGIHKMSTLIQFGLEYKETPEIQT